MKISPDSEQNLADFAASIKKCEKREFFFIAAHCWSFKTGHFSENFLIIVRKMSLKNVRIAQLSACLQCAPVSDFGACFSVCAEGCLRAFEQFVVNFFPVITKAQFSATLAVVLSLRLAVFAAGIDASNARCASADLLSKVAKPGADGSGLLSVCL